MRSSKNQLRFCLGISLSLFALPLSAADATNTSSPIAPLPGQHSFSQSPNLELQLGQLQNQQPGEFEEQFQSSEQYQSTSSLEMLDNMADPAAPHARPKSQLRKSPPNRRSLISRCTMTTTSAT